MKMGATCAKMRLQPVMTPGLKDVTAPAPKVAQAERGDSSDPNPTMLMRPAAAAAALTGGYSIGGMGAEARAEAAEAEAGVEADAVVASTDMA